MGHHRLAAATVVGAAVVEAALIQLGRSYCSTSAERQLALPGDDIVPDPKVVTDHAITDGARTRFHFRSRWTTAPWWFTASGWLGIVPADFYMSRGMLRGVKERAERTAGGRLTSLAA